MRIGEVIKAKKLRPGMRVMVLNADGQPQWQSVVSVDDSWDNGYLDVQLEGQREAEEVNAKCRLVVWGK